MIVRTGASLIDSFRRNKHLAERIRSLGYEPAHFTMPHLMHRWYHKLFKLDPALQLRHERQLARAKRTNASVLICAQIRMGATTALANVGDDTFTLRKDTKKFWSFIRQNLTRPGDDFTLYVTSDKEVRSNRISLS